MYDTAFEETELEELLELYIKNIVSQPEEVEIEKTTSPSGGTEIFTVHVIEDDRGKIIGRDGCIINSMNTIFHALGCKRGRQIEIEIGEDDAPLSGGKVTTEDISEEELEESW
jgi:predicted RNA-binding protein YlqC (UPF0109 family)